MAQLEIITIIIPRHTERTKEIIETLDYKKLNHICHSERKKVKKNTDIYSMAETTAIYFTLKFLGHEKLSILDGGYPYFKKNFTIMK